MLNTQPTNPNNTHMMDDAALSTDATDPILFKHFMACLIDIAKNDSNDLAVFHLNKAIEYYTQNK